MSRNALNTNPGLQLEIEQFYYKEAQFLDAHEYLHWYALFSEDTRYWMPAQSNRLLRDRGKEETREGEVGLFDDDKTTLGWRVRQLGALNHWAENPRSRTRHLITNVRIYLTDADNEYAVRSNFLCYRNRLQDEVDLWAGERQDLLRRGEEHCWLIARRKVVLDQNIVLSKNLSTFF